MGRPWLTGEEAGPLADRQRDRNVDERRTAGSRNPSRRTAARPSPYPANARLEVTYLTDPEVHAAVLPPPLTAPPEPRVRVHFTRIEVDGHLHEIVCSFLLDAMYGDKLGQFCAVMPIDLETAVSPSRERNGEPKKLAQLEFERVGRPRARQRDPPGRHDHRGRRRRHRRAPGAGAVSGRCSSGTSSCPRSRARASTPDRSSSRCTRR